MKNSTIRRQSLFALLAAASTSTIWQSQALAQSGGAPATDQTQALEEIVVTAQKRVQRLQDVPVAVSAFDDRRLEQLDLRSSQDFVRRTPNLSVFSSNRNFSYYVIRGLPVVFGEPNVGVFIDGVYQGSRTGLDTELSNIDRIEILRGPQNTLYGRNTFAGAINILTKKPDDELTGRAELSIGEYGRRDADISLSGPLVDGKLFARVSGSVRSQDGFFVNQLTGEKLDKRNSKTATLVLRTTPVEPLDVSFKLSGERIRDGDYPYQLFRNNALPNALGRNSAFVGTGPYPTVFSFTPGFFDRDALYASLNAQWSGERVSLTSITGFNRIDADSQRDSDYLPQRFQQSDNHNDVHEYSQELRLASSGDADSRLTWLFAVAAYRIKDEVDNSTRFLDENPITRALAPGQMSLLVSHIQNRSEIESKSAFGQITYEVLDDLRLTGGLRYDSDKKSFEQTSRGLGGVTVYPGPTDPGTQKFDFWSWKVAADYHWTPDIMTFGSVALGQRAGGFNADGALTPDERLYGNERIYSYELGLKSEWFSRRLRANITGFYIVWENQQNSTGFFRNGVLLQPIVNTPSGAEPTSKGVEVELALRPLDGLDLAVNYGYTDSTYDEFDFRTVATAVGLPAEAGVLDGNRQVLTPKHSLSASAYYETPISDSWRLFGGADLRYESKKFASQFNLDAVGPYTVVDANLGVANDHFKVTLFAKNLFDEKYTVARALARNYSLPGTPTESGFAPGDPQQFGVRLAASF